VKSVTRLGWGRALLLAAVLVAVFVGTAAAQKGTLTDSRDGKTYKTVKIGGKTWMAENLNHQPKTGKSWCFGNEEFNCKKYGRLYDWNTAKKACPAGWHLSTVKEWDNLSKAAGGTRHFFAAGCDPECSEEEANKGSYVWLGAGAKLQSTSGWCSLSNTGGTDDYGFSALPGAFRASDGDFSVDGGHGSGWWWTDKEKSEWGAYCRSMTCNGDEVFECDIIQTTGLSVRCVQD